MVAESIPSISPVTVQSAAWPSAATRTTDEGRSRTAVDPDSPRSRKARVRESDDDEEEEEYAKARRRRIRRRRSPPSFSWGPVYIGLFGFLGATLVLSLLLGLFYPYTAALFLLLMINLGFFLMLAGAIMMLALAFRNDIMDGVLCIIIPFYMLYYLAKNYDDLRRAFHIHLIGILYLVSPIIGMGILTAIAGPPPNRAAVANAPPQFAMQGQVPAAPPVAVNPQFVVPRMQPQALVAAKVSGDPQIDALIADIEAGDLFRARRAGDALRSIFVKPEIQAVVADKLAQLAKSPVNEVRRAAAMALGSWATTKEFPALIEMGKGANGWELRELLPSLARFKDERSIPVAIQGMRELPSRHEAGQLLRSFAPKSEPFLLPLLRNEDLFTTLGTMDILRDVGTPACIPALQELAAGPDPHFRLTANAAIQAIERRQKR